MTWSGPARRVRAALPAVLLIGLLVTPLLAAAPASADSWSKRDDNAQDDALAADYDITKVRWRYTDSKLVIKAKFREVRTDDFEVVAVARHADEGYPIYAITRWSEGQQETTLRIDYGGSSAYPTCRGLKAKWKAGAGGSVEITIPNKCTFRGWPLDRFEVWSAAPGAPYAFDSVESQRKRRSG